LDAPDEWAAQLRGVRHSFAHTWNNCHAMHLTTGYPTYLFCFETDDIRIVCPVAERARGEHIDVVTPYGFSGFVGNSDCSEFPARWREFVRARRYVCGYVQLNPLWDNETYYAANEAHEYNTVYVIDLRPSLDEIFMRFEKRRRKQVRDAAGVDIVWDRGRLKEFFLNNYEDFFARRHAAGVYSFTRATIEQLCDADDVLLVGCGSRGTLEAAAMLGCTAYGGDALFQVSVPGGEHHAAALVWSRVEYAKSIGLEFLNLGGGVREHDGIAKFKERFGAVKRPLRCLKQVYDWEIYEHLCHEAAVDPASDGYFPPYRRP
jgi:hypothetical protein